MRIITQKTVLGFGYIKAILKWTVLSVIIGFAAGLAGTLFHMSVEWVTHLRGANTWIIYLMPVAAVFIAFAYSLFKKYGRLDTNRIIEGVNDGSKIPKIILPLIFVCASISHLVGASVGREGAALQLGGSAAGFVSSAFRLERRERRIAAMSGMSAAFAALFGTPVTAAVFALEVASVGVMRYTALFPCVLSAYVAFLISGFLGVEATMFSLPALEINLSEMCLALVLAVVCALLSRVFCSTIHHTEKISKKYMPNAYIRALTCSLAVVLLTLVVGTYDYNGAGMHIVEGALSGGVRPEAFALKLIFTSLSIAAGFKGGEIVPAFFVGSTFGCVAASLVGFDASIGAAIGFVALFCGAVNCPVASLVLALEVFGERYIMLFALVCALSYMLSGKEGLYHSQKVLFLKTEIKS